MQQLLYYICLSLICFLLFFENIGFLFRIAGLRIGNIVAGYTFQSSWSFASRFINLLFAPIFAYLADSRNLIIEFRHLCYFYFLLYFLILLCIINFDKIVDLLSNIVSKQQEGLSLFSSIFRIEVLNKISRIIFRPSSYNIFRNSKCLKQQNKGEEFNKYNKDFAITYILFYGCWIFISILISNFPNKPAFIISTATYYTLISTVYQSVYYDPWISRYSNNLEYTHNTYLSLFKYRLNSVLFSFLLSTIGFIFFKVKIYF